MRNFKLTLIAGIVSGAALGQTPCGPIGNDPVADKTCFLNNGTPMITVKSGAQIGGTLWPTLIQAQAFFANYNESILGNSPLVITSGTDDHDPANSGCGHFEGCKLDFRITDQSNTSADSVSKYIISDLYAQFAGCRSNDNAPKWKSLVGVSGGSIFAMEKSTPPYPLCNPYTGPATGPHWDFLTSFQQISTPWDGTQGLSVEVGQAASISPTAYGVQGQTIPMQPPMFEYDAPEDGEFGIYLANIDAAGNVTGLNVGTFNLYVSAGSNCGFFQEAPQCAGIIDTVPVTITANDPPGGGPKCVFGPVPPGGCWNWDPSSGGWVWNPGNSSLGGTNPPGSPPRGGQVCSASASGPCWQWDPTANNGAGEWVLNPQGGGSSSIWTSPTINPTTSHDPNAIAGPVGTGGAQYISGTDPLVYAVFFQNDPTATAAALQVVVTDQIDPTKFNLSTITLGPITFPGYPAVVPPSIPLLILGQFSTQVSLLPSINLLVNVKASLSPSGLLTWTLQAIDPTTGLPPSNPQVGLLPPGGAGSLSFFVSLNPGLATGTIVNDQAGVTFDANAPISTAIWSNTLDVTPPTSSVSALPAAEPSASFLVSWSGTDLGSAIQSYTIYVSDSGGPYSRWLTQTTNTSAKFVGNIGHTYSFYSVATDLAGNTESAKTSPDTTTAVTVPCAVDSGSSFTISRGGFRLNHATQQFTQSVTIQNKSASPIIGPVSVVLDDLSANATLTGGNGITACNAPLNSEFVNLNLGAANSLAPGASSTVTLTFTNPSQDAITYSTRVLSGAGVR